MAENDSADSPRATANGILDELDHPIIFVLAVLMIVIVGQSLVRWGATNLNLPGLKALAK